MRHTGARSDVTNGRALALSALGLDRAHSSSSICGSVTGHTTTRFKKPRLGVAYYPEQWPRDRWRLDASRMAELGLTLVRMGEFAWSQMEPHPGQFDLEWLDEAVEIFATAGLKVILGTPTPAPPAWLIAQHPAIFPLTEHRRRLRFGNRRHYCPNQPPLREATARILSTLTNP